MHRKRYKKEVITNTAKFLSYYTQMFTLDSNEMVVVRAKELTFVLQYSGPLAPYQVGHNLMQPLDDLLRIFEHILLQPIITTIK